MIHRTAVMLENGNDLTVDVNYTLTDGEMELWLSSRSGKLLKQREDFDYRDAHAEPMIPRQ